MSKQIEEPSYEVIRRIGDVELRAYAPMILAITDVDGDLDHAQSEGFRRLAAYIFGGNSPQQSIEMTAPVTTAPVKIPMTAPVSTSLHDGKSYRVSFTMPASMTLETLPQPHDERVTLIAQPRRTVAVLAFSGLCGQARVKRKQESLLATLASEGLDTQGAPSLSRYDPPWTLPFLRRNEVQIELATSA